MTEGNDGWIEWHGDGEPVANEAIACVRFRNGEIGEGAKWNWIHDNEGGEHEIVAYRVQDTTRMFADGNNGGDFVAVTFLQDKPDVLRIEVGHCCVHVFDYDVPVELVTALFNDMMIRHGSPEKFIQSLGWPQEFKDQLIGKVAKVT